MKEVEQMDFLSFKALYESCERCHAADVLEATELKMAVAAYGAGAEDGWDVLQERLALYRFILGLDAASDAVKGPMELMAVLRNGRL